MLGLYESCVCGPDPPLSPALWKCRLRCTLQQRPPHAERSGSASLSVQAAFFIYGASKSSDCFIFIMTRQRWIFWKKKKACGILFGSPLRTALLLHPVVANDFQAPDYFLSSHKMGFAFPQKQVFQHKQLLFDEHLLSDLSVSRRGGCFSHWYVTVWTHLTWESCLLPLPEKEEPSWSLLRLPVILCDLFGLADVQDEIIPEASPCQHLTVTYHMTHPSENSLSKTFLEFSHMSFTAWFTTFYS